MRISILAATALAGSVALAAPAAAAPITLTGDFLQVSINDVGTFGLRTASGTGSGSRPAFVHDPTGTGTFDLSTDYIAPGVPHDGFSVISDQFPFLQNDNTGPVQFGTNSPVLLMGADARGYANAVSWTGSISGQLSITNSYFFNPGDERVLVETSITALTDLTNLAFARSVDPDSGGTNSINQRGNVNFDLEDFIGSESVTNGRTLALVNVNNSGFTNNTSINGSCCSNIDPYDVLSNSGGDLGNSSTGDHGLNIAYSIGDLLAGGIATFQYAYVAGLGLDDIVVDPGDPGEVPAPGALGLLGLGLLGVGIARRRRRTASAA